MPFARGRVCSAPLDGEPPFQRQLVSGAPKASLRVFLGALGKPGTRWYALLCLPLHPSLPELS